jgi:tetratricopeptide (TPR) repeat protein
VPDNDDKFKNPFEGFRIEIDPERVDEVMGTIRKRITHTFKTGRYTKVRFSYRGKNLLPDIPLAVFLATEGVAFLLLSPLSALLVNLGAGALLDVEFVHEADELVAEGLGLYMDGELERAEECYRKALKKRADDPSALYNLGTLLRVTDRREEAMRMLRKAAMGPEGHPDVLRAAESLERME